MAWLEERERFDSFGLELPFAVPAASAYGAVATPQAQAEWGGDHPRRPLRGPSAIDAVGEWFDQSFEYDSLPQGAAADPKDAVRAAIAGGERDDTKLTNLVFFARHPDRDPATPLDPKASKAEAALAAEWLKIRTDHVMPVIEQLAEDSVLKVRGKWIAARLAAFRGKPGERFKRLLETTAKKFAVDVGLLAAVTIAETGGPSSYLLPGKVSSYHAGVDDFFNLRGLLAKYVPAYGDIKWDKRQKPREHLNDAQTNPRIVKTIDFDSGADALRATAAYLKYAEIRLREDAVRLGGDFDKLPVETRLALIRMSMGAGRGGAESRLVLALAGKDILLRNWKPPVIYHTNRNATIRAAEALFLSRWVFGAPPVTTTVPKTNPEAWDMAGEDLDWLAYEQPTEEGESWLGEESASEGEWGASEEADEASFALEDELTGETDGSSGEVDFADEWSWPEAADSEEADVDVAGFAESEARVDDEGANWAPGEWRPTVPVGHDDRLAPEEFASGEHYRAGDGLYPNALIVGQKPGVAFSYGHIITMADLYETPDQMMGASVGELRTLRSLIDNDIAHYAPGGKSKLAPDTTDWEKATSNRKTPSYLKLAEDNYEHFAPNILFPNAKFISSVSKHGDHKSAWEKYHLRALREVKSLDPRLDLTLTYNQRPLIINAFGDHFLTDAFSAGHIINKAAIKDLFVANFYRGGKLTAAGESFFKTVANFAFKGRLAAKFSVLETYQPKFLWWNPNINSASRFASLLIAIANDKAHRDRIANLAVKALHDKLNKEGIKVTNGLHAEPWRLTGDGYLTDGRATLADGTCPNTLQKMQEAVRQSVANILDPIVRTDAFWEGTPSPMVRRFMDRVWAHVPQLTQESLTQLRAHAPNFINPKSVWLATTAAKLLEDEVDTLIKELLVPANKALRKA